MLLHEKNSFRQVCDKPCVNPIIYAEWSPVRDLIAVITTNGEVRLHRMHWQKVWILPAKEKRATCLSWNPDGRTIAVGFDNGSVSLIEIEKATTVHSLQCDGKITSIQWDEQDTSEFYLHYKEGITEYLPQFRKEEVVAAMQKVNLILSNKSLVILSIGTEKGDISLYLDGVFLIMKITKDKLGDQNETYKIIKTNLLMKQGIIMIICQGSDDKKYYYYNFYSQLLSSRNEELMFLSKKYLKCSDMLTKSNDCFKQMADTSEDVYLKIITKIKSLEKLIEGCNSSVALEFTMSYATGKSSPELQTFFTQVLTTKTLTQLAQSVLLSYTSLDNDIKDEFDLYMQHLVFHLTEIAGIAKWFEKFGVLGLSLEDINKTQATLIQICMKIKQLKYLINIDMKYFNVFFTWLTDFIYDSSGETNPNKGTSTFDNNDYDMMLEFLENRLQKNGNDTYKFEQVNQFFKDSTLDSSLSNDNEWFQFVSENKILDNCPSIIKPDQNSSLFHLMEKLKTQIETVFSNASDSLSSSVHLLFSTCLFTHVDNHAEDCKSSFQFLNCKEYNLLNVTPCSCDASSSYILKLNNEFNVECYGFTLDQQDTLNESKNVLYTLRDVKFYNNDLLTLLFEEEDQTTKNIVSYLAQLQITEAMNENMTINTDMETGVLENESIQIPMQYVLDNINEIRKMESFLGKQVNVNGYSRQVSIVISMSRRRVRVFDMTAEDDLDDTKDESKLTNNTMRSETDEKENTTIE